MSTTPTGDATVVDPDVAGAYATGTGITPMQRKVLLGGSVGQFEAPQVLCRSHTGCGSGLRAA